MSETHHSNCNVDGIKDALTELPVETKDDEVRNETDMNDFSHSDNFETVSSTKSRELKSILALSKEANLDTNIFHKRKSTDGTKPEQCVKTDSSTELTQVKSTIVRVDYSKQEGDIPEPEVTKNVTEEDSSRRAAEMVDRDRIDSNEKLNNAGTNAVIFINNKKKDPFCWRCHHEKPTFYCGTCPRSFHQKCLKHNMAQTDNWTCPVCIDVYKTKSFKKRPLEQFSGLLKFALKRMMQIEGHEPFILPVNESEFPEYKTYVAHPQDLTNLEKNIKNNAYTNTREFETDAQWILHNSIIFNSYQSKLTSIAKSIFKICKQEMTEIENCSSCYLNANTKKKTWFVEVCPKPHMVVWAKLKGFPYWPAKAMRTNSLGMVDVRFFGAHDRAWVPCKDCFLYCEQDPNSNKQKRNDINQSIKEVKIYIENLKHKYREFRYAPYRVTLDPERQTEQLRMLLPKYDPSKKKNKVGEKSLNGNCNSEGSEKSLNEESSLDDSMGSTTLSDYGSDSNLSDRSPGGSNFAGRTYYRMRGGLTNLSGRIKVVPRAYPGKKRPPSDEIKDRPPKLFRQDSSDQSSSQSVNEDAKVPSDTKKTEGANIVDEADCPKLTAENNLSSEQDPPTNSETTDLNCERLSNLIDKELQKEKNVLETDSAVNSINGQLDANVTELPKPLHTTESTNEIPTQNHTEPPNKSEIHISPELPIEPKSPSPSESSSTEIESQNKFKSPIKPKSPIKFSSTSKPKSPRKPPSPNVPKLLIKCPALIKPKSPIKFPSPNKPKLLIKCSPPSKSKSPTKCLSENKPKSPELQDKTESPNESSESKTESASESELLNKSESLSSESELLIEPQFPNETELPSKPKLSRKPELSSGNDLLANQPNLPRGFSQPSFTETKNTDKVVEVIVNITEPTEPDVPAIESVNIEDVVLASVIPEVSILPLEPTVRDPKKIPVKDIESDHIIKFLNNSEVSLAQINKTKHINPLQIVEVTEERNGNEEETVANKKADSLKISFSLKKADHPNQPVEGLKNKKRKRSSDSETNMQEILLQKKALKLVNIDDITNKITVKTVPAPPRRSTTEPLQELESLLHQQLLGMNKNEEDFDNMDSITIKSEPNSEDEMSEAAYMDMKRKYLSALNISEKQTQAPKKNVSMRTRSKSDENKIKSSSNLAKVINEVATLYSKSRETEEAVRSAPVKRKEIFIKPLSKIQMPKQKARKSFPEPSYRNIYPPQTQKKEMIRVAKSIASSVVRALPAVKTNDTLASTSNVMYITHTPSPTTSITILPPNQPIAYASNRTNFVTMLPHTNNFVPIMPATIGKNANEKFESQNYIPMSGEVVKPRSSTSSIRITITTVSENTTTTTTTSTTQIASAAATVTSSPNLIITSATSDILESLGTASSSTLDSLNKTMSEIMCRAPPKLKRRPPGPLNEHFDEGLPSSAGRVTSKINSISHRLGDYFRGMLTELLREMATTDTPEAEIVKLKLENEELKHKHNEEILEIKKNVSTILRDVQKSIDAERNRIVEDTRSACESECVKRVEEAKSKQWCANCTKEAQFYCCWNTSYCDFPCQEKHWPKHMSMCTQNVQNARGSKTNTTSTVTVNNTTASTKTPQAPPQPFIIRQTTASKGFTSKGLIAKPTKLIVNRQASTKSALNYVRTSGNHITLVESTPGNYELLGNGGPISVGGKLLTGLGKIRSNVVPIQQSSSSGPSNTAVVNTQKPVILNQAIPVQATLISDDEQ